MQVILSEEQEKQIQLLVFNIIQYQLNRALIDRGYNSPYLNKQQTCNYLGISNNTLDSWIAKGLPVIRVGKTVRFTIDDIADWLNNHKQYDTNYCN